MSTVIVNGKTYNVSGKNVSAINNKVYCDGKLVTDCNNCKEKEIHITVEGNVERLNVDCGNVTVNRECGDVTVDSGNVNASWILGSVSVDAGNVKIDGDVGGNVKVDTGNVKCNTVKNGTETNCGTISKNRTSSFMKNIKNIITFK